MKRIVDFLNSKNLIFSSLKQLENGIIQNKTKITVYEGIDLQKQYWLILIYPNSSRIIKHQLNTFLILEEKAIRYCDHNFAVQALIFNTSICSQVVTKLKGKGWKIYSDFV